MYKDTLKDLVDSSDIEPPVIPRQTNLPKNDISSFKDNPSDPEVNDNLSDRLQGQPQYQDTPPLS